MTCGEFAKPQHRIGVAVCAYIGKDRNCEVVFAESVEKLRGADYLEPLDSP